LEKKLDLKAMETIFLKMKHAFQMDAMKDKIQST
jgi:hypothetical protein